MGTQQAVESSLKPERVQEPVAAGAAPLTTEGLVLYLKAERVQEPTLAAEGANVSYTYAYELAVNQPQQVLIELPIGTITLLGDPGWGAAGGLGGKEASRG